MALVSCRYAFSAYSLLLGSEGGGLRGGKHEAGGVALLRQPIVEEVHRVHPPHGCKYLFIYYFILQINNNICAFIIHYYTYEQ